MLKNSNQEGVANFGSDSFRAPTINGKKGHFVNWMENEMWK